MIHALDDPAPDDPARLWVRVENADKSRVITCRVGGTGQQQGGKKEEPSQPPENLDRALQDLLNRAREVQQQNPDLARRLLEQLLAQDPQNQEALRLLQQLGPVGLNQTPTPSQPNPSQVEQLLKEAGTLEYQASAALPNKAQAQQYLLQARQKYEAILSLDPGNAQARSGIDSVDVQMRTLQR
jgi:hypothetical protein